MSLKAKLLWYPLGAGLAAFLIFVAVEKTFRLRDRVSASSAYRDPGDNRPDRERTKAAIRFRIAQLLRPDEGAAAVSGDRSGRLIEAGHLHGRLALIEEAEGNMPALDRHMADAVNLLRRGGLLDATEDHVRDVVKKQGLR